MKTQVTTFASLTHTTVAPLMAITSLSRRLAETDCLQNLSELFSAVLEEDVSPMQTLCLLNSVLSLFMVVFPIGIPFLLRILFLVWFVLSLLQCRQAAMGN